MQLIMNIEEFFFSIFVNKHCLSLAGTCPVIVWLIKALRTLFSILTLIATIKPLLFTTIYIWTFTLIIKRSVWAAAKYRTASSTPFAQKAMITWESTICCHINIFSCRFYNLSLPFSTTFIASIFVRSLHCKGFTIYTWFLLVLVCLYTLCFEIIACIIHS